MIVPPDADQMLLAAIEQQVQGVLGSIQRIAELLETHKTVAPIEELPQKINAEVQKIRSLLTPKQSINQDQTLENGKRSLGGIAIAKNPLINDMGGMPLEVVSPEWQDLMLQNVLDKTELENMVNNKLKDRVDLANKLKLGLKNKLAAAPKMRATPASPAITPKFKKIQNTIKYIVKNIPKPSEPKPTAPRPRPQGM
jgi:hypothetical protein